VTDYCFYRLFGIRGPFPVFRNSYCPLTWSFKSLWSWMSFVVVVIFIVVGLPAFMGASYTCNVLSALVVSVSMSLVRRGAKKLRVQHWFWWQLNRCRCWLTGLVDFLVVCEVLLENSSCVSLLPGSRPGPLIPLTFFHCTTSSCLWTLLQDCLHFICVTIYSPQRALKSVFLSRPLQTFALFSALFTIPST
jgi:hypothetical protein